MHVYNEQAVVHEEVLTLRAARRGEPGAGGGGGRLARGWKWRRAGLNATVIQDYYAIVAAQRKLANSQSSVAEAERFLDITQKQEQGGEVAHADVIKAQIDLQQRQTRFEGSAAGDREGQDRAGRFDFPEFQHGFRGGGRFRGPGDSAAASRKRRRRRRPPVRI